MLYPAYWRSAFEAVGLREQPTTFSTRRLSSALAIGGA